MCLKYTITNLDLRGFAERGLEITRMEHVNDYCMKHEDTIVNDDVSCTLY